MVLSGVRISAENMAPQLKLVLMSATLRVEDFISGRRLFQTPPPIIEVPTRLVYSSCNNTLLKENRDCGLYRSSL